MNTKEIGEKITLLRTKKGLTKNALANLAGVSPTYIYQLERGEKCPTVEYLNHICWGLGVTLAEFFSEEAEPNDKLSYLTAEQRKKLNDFLNSL
ncbi:MAG: helix-turn-helix domain-containing protein [Clostridia bacterium]|nr:helix-turn-helix domain-containing protein [Clostridia bacterium]MCD8309507.1 helix-turn-helix domain-containing protein [Clostridia bacterium]